MKKGQSKVKYTFLFIKFILPEFVSYLGEIWVLCVRNVLMNMSNITFGVTRLGRPTFVFKKCSDKI